MTDMRYFLFLAFTLLVSCQTEKDHGHAHGHGSGHSHDQLTVDTTIWTQKTELFVEFPPLVVGQISRFAAHFTELQGHQAIQEGKVTVSLIKNDKGIRQTVDAPSSPGLFTPALQPKQAGDYQLVFNLNTPNYQEKINYGAIRVFANAKEAQVQKKEEEGINFLKEQAWKMDFQTAPVAVEEVFQRISAIGTWQSTPANSQTLVATTDGVVSFKGNTLTEGMRIGKGVAVMSIQASSLTKNNLNAEINKAKAVLEQAKALYDRKKTLYESKITPKSEFELVERDYKMALSSYHTLSNGYGEGGKTIVTPKNGIVSKIMVDNGAFVKQGDPLMVIADKSSNILEVQVNPRYFSLLSAIKDVWYQPQSEQWSSISKTGGRILSIANEVNKSQPLLSVFVQVNEPVSMPKGGFSAVELTIGKGKKSVVIPQSALLEDYGQYAVIVQKTGESFEKRQVTLGVKNGNQLEITSGLQPNEIIVTTGAYQVKMAALSGQAPAHGHSH